MHCPAVRLVVLNFNGGDLVLRCVESLESLDWPRDRLDLVVVDNASSDGSDRDIEEHFPAVRVIRSDSNLGFPANNLGLRDLLGIDYVGLVNNDAFVEPGWLRALVLELELDPKVGAACPKIIFATQFVDLVITSPPWRAPGDGRDLGVRMSGLELDGVDVFPQAGFASGCHALEHGTSEEPAFRWLAGRAVVRLPVAPGAASPRVASVRLANRHAVEAVLLAGGASTSADVGTAPAWYDVEVAGQPYDVINNVGSELVAGGWGADRGFLERDVAQYEEPQDVFAWCGAGVLFRPGYLQDVGLFDERFFMYYEDTDLAWRGRARGWRYRYTPDAVMRHVHAATSVEGSSMFQHYVERNRLVMLAKNAPRSMVRRAILRFLSATVSYAVRDVARPVLRGHRPALGLVVARVKSFVAFLRMYPQLLRDRRSLRARQLVPDRSITGWAVHR
ncbi:MAG: glycosyltransferase [Actinomycetota bacterium]